MESPPINGRRHRNDLSLDRVLLETPFSGYQMGEVSFPLISESLALVFHVAWVRRQAVMVMCWLSYRPPVPQNQAHPLPPPALWSRDAPAPGREAAQAPEEAPWLQQSQRWKHSRAF